MRSPEEVARNAWNVANEPLAALDWRASADKIADLIRARDAEVRVDAYARALAYLASVHSNLESNGEKRAAEIAQGWLVKATADLFGGGGTSG